MYQTKPDTRLRQGSKSVAYRSHCSPVSEKHFPRLHLLWEPVNFQAVPHETGFPWLHLPGTRNVSDQVVLPVTGKVDTSVARRSHCSPMYKRISQDFICLGVTRWSTKRQAALGFICLGLPQALRLHPAWDFQKPLSARFKPDRASVEPASYQREKLETAHRG